MKYPRTGKRGAPQVFPRKLYEILSNESSRIIAWTESGTSFVIKDMDTFVTDILMKYFRHQKYSSFQRQLNLYGFRKISKGSEMGCYIHEYFHRDGMDDLTYVRRTPQAPSVRQDVAKVQKKHKLDGGGASSTKKQAKKRPCCAVSSAAKSVACCAMDKASSADDDSSAQEDSGEDDERPEEAEAGWDLDVGTPTLEADGLFIPTTVAAATKAEPSSAQPQPAPVAFATPVHTHTTQPLSFEPFVAEPISDGAPLLDFDPFVLGSVPEPLDCHTPEVMGRELGSDAANPGHTITWQPRAHGAALQAEADFLKGIRFDANVHELSESVHNISLGARDTGTPQTLDIPPLVKGESSMGSLGFGTALTSDLLPDALSLGWVDRGDSDRLELNAIRHRTASMSSDDWALGGGIEPIPFESVFPAVGLSSGAAQSAPRPVEMER